MTNFLELKFWGVRGSIPAPGPSTAGFGGNTACLEVRRGNRPPLIFDGGSGIRQLGLELAARETAPPDAIHIFLTHFHWDHIQGIPFFVPLFRRGWRLIFYSAGPRAVLQRLMSLQLSSPYFPAQGSVAAEVEYAQVPPDGVRVGEETVLPVPLCHPGGATGYRIEADQARIVYASDHEHGCASTDTALRENAFRADVLIWDGQYTAREYESRKGWGHSTAAEGASAALDAQVGQLVIFHHDPQRSDSGVSRLVEEARETFPNTMGAREGAVIRLPALTSPVARPDPGYAATYSA